MRIKLDYNHMMADFLGEKGISTKEVEDMREKALSAQKNVQTNRGTGWLGWMELPYNQGEVVAKVLSVAKEIRAKYDNFVVLGIGGSALGPIAVQQALNHYRYNELPAEKRNGPKLFVEDNVDPERMAALLDVIDVKKTCFNVVTKSGATSETMSQYLIIRDVLEKTIGKDYTKQIIATTDAQRGNLIKIARQDDLVTFTIPDGVGGRFSEMCPVGLLPAAVCGIDIEEMLAGARLMDDICKQESLEKNPALIAATLMTICMQQKGYNISVMMPYADALKTVADWYVQLWAESLGKKMDKAGNVINVGQTPVKALGTTDQHSQVQLYTEGPYDKVTTFIGVEKYRASCTIPQGCDEFPDVNFLCGRTLDDLMQAEQFATEYALVQAGRVSMTITLPQINPFTIGQLLYFFEMQTAYAGELLHIDAFDQPGVEGGKIATFALMDRKGFEGQKADMQARPPRKSEYQV